MMTVQCHWIEFLGLHNRIYFRLPIVITDKGRILKNRSGPDSKVIPSFDLVKQDMPVKNKLKSTSKSKYRSIFDPMDVQAEL